MPTPRDLSHAFLIFARDLRFTGRLLRELPARIRRQLLLARHCVMVLRGSLSVGRAAVLHAITSRAFRRRILRTLTSLAIK